jgi:hypothetical protein
MEEEERKEKNHGWRLSMALSRESQARADPRPSRAMAEGMVLVGEARF